MAFFTNWTFNVRMATDAEIEDNNPDVFDSIGPGAVFYILFRYRPGRHPTAHGFRVWWYETAAERSADFETDVGMGLALVSPEFIAFTPAVPQNATNENVWLFGQLAARVPIREQFAEDATEHTFFAKITILQD